MEAKMKITCFSLRSSRRKSRDPCPEHFIAGSGYVKLTEVNVGHVRRVPGGTEQGLNQKNFHFTSKECQLEGEEVKRDSDRRGGPCFRD